MNKAVDSFVVVLQQKGLYLSVVSSMPLVFSSQRLLKLSLMTYSLLVDEGIVHDNFIWANSLYWAQSKNNNKKQKIVLSFLYLDYAELSIYIFDINQTLIFNQQLMSVAEDLFKDCQIAEPIIQSDTCDHGFKRMCLNRWCDLPSLHCEHHSCQNSFKQHFKCQTTSLSGVTSYLREHYKTNQHFFEQFYALEEKFIESIQVWRQSKEQQLEFGKLQKRFEQMIDSIYRRSSGEQLTGKMADSFFKKLTGLTKIDFSTDELLNKLSSLYDNILIQLKKAREDILKEYMNKVKDIKDYVKMNIQSQILFMRNQQPKMLENLYNNLSKPKQLRLIFRASDNLFSGAKFHQMCDNQSPTFVVIQTDHKLLGTIGFYNGNSWNSQSPDFKDSFALISHFQDKRQIEYKRQNPFLNFTPQPFSFFKTEKVEKSRLGPTLIFNARDYPRYRYGISISDECQQNSQSFFNIPLDLSPHGNNQDFYRKEIFGESTFNNKIRVINYEVFKVIMK